MFINNSFYQQNTCPSCGYCPHCRRGGYTQYPGHNYNQWPIQTPVQSEKERQEQFEKLRAMIQGGLSTVQADITKGKALSDLFVSGTTVSQVTSDGSWTVTAPEKK